MSASELLDELTALETELHRAEVRRDPDRLDALLHPFFVEFGRSGRRYKRDEILEELSGESNFPRVHADEFEVRRIAADAALLTYRSAHIDDDGTLHRFTLRSSIWQRDDGRWRMLFHQGTAAE